MEAILMFFGGTTLPIMYGSMRSEASAFTASSTVNLASSASMDCASSPCTSLLGEARKNRPVSSTVYTSLGT
ncbi:hypothetical protein PC116_g32969 [Phytophthora cactorum]|nr:hypothetical protein PC116_g32969 [Phytophthora cactorum]